MVNIYLLNGILCLVGMCLGGEREPKCYSRLTRKTNIPETCSVYEYRFDFEEKLLEKAVRNDIQMKQILDIFNTSMRALEDQKTALEAKNAKLTALIEDLETSITNKVVTAQMKKFGLESARVSAKIEDFRTTILDRVQEQLESIKQPFVLFSARELRNTSPIVGTTLLYNTVDWNFGNAFDQATGIFTAPLNGTYQFSVMVCTFVKQWASVQIVVNQQAIQSVINNNHGANYTTSSGVIIIILTQGDQVQIKQHFTTGGYVENNYCWNQFNGALVYKNH